MNMKLITAAKSETASHEMQQIIAELIPYVEAQLRRLHQLVNTPGHEQAIMDRFGENGVKALTAYAAFQSALSVVKPDHSAPEPNMDVFVPQKDGYVLYQAPVAPPTALP
jgi:hypothetical protein